MKREDIKIGMQVVPWDNSYSVDLTTEGKAGCQYWAGTYNSQARVATVLFLSNEPLPIRNLVGFETSVQNNIVLKDASGNIRITCSDFIQPYTSEGQLYRNMEIDYQIGFEE